MKLHYFADGSIEMVLKWRGKLIQKTFLCEAEYIDFIRLLS